MSYWVVCNWCGRTIGKDDDRAVLTVTIDRRIEQTVLGRKWDEEVRPTLHFCVGQRIDANRMGMDFRDLGLEDGSCFERAIATVNGTKASPPDMGMEWRLMPTNDDGSGRRDGTGTTSSGERFWTPMPQDRDEHRREWKSRFAQANEVGGIGWLRLDHATFRALIFMKVLMVDELRERSDEELLMLKSIGPARVREIRNAIEMYDRLVAGKES